MSEQNQLNTDPLNRFIQAQNNTYKSALKEIKQGCKRSHWMHFIFPQLNGLGQTPIAQHFALKDEKEAQLYLSHTLLGARLRQITTHLLNKKGTQISYIFSTTDAMKLKSSMTLFDKIAPNDIFSQVLESFFKGERDQKTLDLLNNKPDLSHLIHQKNDSYNK